MAGKKQAKKARKPKKAKVRKSKKPFASTRSADGRFPI